MSQASLPPPQSYDAPVASSTSPRVPPPSPANESLSPVESTVKRLRAELSGTTDKARQARLLAEIGDIEERAGDEPAAARDYLAAFNADPSFREPLEGLVRLLERRRSLKNLGRLVDALSRAAVTPDERGRALLMKAAYLEDVSQDLDGAAVALREASEIDLPSAEAASVWLSLELLSAKQNNPALRLEALLERAKRAVDPTWKGLLLIDAALLTAAGGDADRALDLLHEACALEGEATWSAACAIERLVRRGADNGSPATLAVAIETQATLLEKALADAAVGDSYGVPRWSRTAANVADAWLRAAEARRAGGELAKAAELLDHALERYAEPPADEQEAFVIMALQTARMRVAELMGDTALAASLAEKRLAHEKDGGVAASLAMRVAELAANEGDSGKALQALSLAIERDPACVPARALQLDLLADGGDVAAFAAQLESFADHLESDEARGRAFLLAAWTWGVRAGDVPGAKAALTQAAMYGVPPATIARVARTMAAVRGDMAWYEDATRRLLANGASDEELPHLWFELARTRLAREDVEGAFKALRELGNTAGGAWLGRVLEAFLPVGPHEGGGLSTAGAERRRTALEELSLLDPDRERARALAVLAAVRAHAAGDLDAARAQLRPLADDDLFAAILLADLERLAGQHAAAAEHAASMAASTPDPELSAALLFEAGFGRWQAGDRDAALAALKEAATRAPEAGKQVLAWAARCAALDTLEGRRRANAWALEAGDDPQAIALERFATEIDGGDPDEAARALDTVTSGEDPTLATAAALAQLIWRRPDEPVGAADAALQRLEQLGPNAKVFAAVERVERARREGPEALVAAARAWYESGGGLVAAIEWLTAATAQKDANEEQLAHAAVAQMLTGDAAEAMTAAAALSRSLESENEHVPLVEGMSPAVRLANLDLAPPGCDPRRRATALVGVEGVLGDDAQVDALGLAGWSALATGDVEAALTAFRKVVEARPEDLAAWEGVRTCAEIRNDKATRAWAAGELGARCANPARGAAFWEEAGLLWLELGDGDRAEAALQAGFDRDPTRAVGFDKLFRRVRDRKDGEKLLELIDRRLKVAEEPKEIIKLHWERARVRREMGDSEGALRSLEHVTKLEPDHVGALALTGEIAIRQGRFEEAATALARLSQLETAPAKNRLTAAIAAVDLYENKLQAYDKAFAVLSALYRAKLAPLPLRERLARTAARVGAWRDAAAVLEELMTERTDPEGRREAARLAMAIHRDRLANPEGARPAIVKLLEESPMDGEALDMLLTTEHPVNVRERLLVGARNALVAHLRVRPIDPAGVRRLVKVARGLGDAALEQTALAVAIALGHEGSTRADDEAEARLGRLMTAKARTPRAPMTDAMFHGLMAPGDEGPIAELFMLLGPTLAEALGPSLSSCGVGRRDRVDARAGSPLRDEVAAWASAFGIHQFELYVGGRDPERVQGIPGETPALVVGAGIRTPLSPAVRGRVARELVAMVRGTTALRSHDEATIAAVVAAACRLGGVPVEPPSALALTEVEKPLSKAISRKTKKLLPDICRAIAASRVDARVWATRALASHDRVATLASGDVATVLADVLRTPREQLGPAIRASERAEELLRFVFSPAYLEMRRTLGLEGAS